MKEYNGYKYLAVPELPKRGKKNTMYWVKTNDCTYEGYVYESKHWNKVDERKCKGV